MHLSTHLCQVLHPSQPGRNIPSHAESLKFFERQIPSSSPFPPMPPFSRGAGDYLMASPLPDLHYTGRYLYLYMYLYLYLYLYFTCTTRQATVLLHDLSQ